MKNKNRTIIVYVFWKKVDGLLRIDIETNQNIARKLLTHMRRTHGGEPTRNQNEKQDGRKIHNTAV